MNLLVLSGVASAINYIRSLADTPGITLFVSDCDPYCPGLYHPAVTPVLLPRARDAGYRQALAQAMERHAVDAVVPTSDYDVEAVINWQRDGWKPSALMFRPPYEAYARLGYKDKLAAWLGRSFPEAIPRSFPADVAPEGLPYPVVAKPANMSGGKDVAICRAREDFVAARSRLTRLYGDAVLVQEYVPGSTYVLAMVYDHAGKPVVAAVMRSTLTFFTWGGGGMAGEMTDEPELVKLGQDMIAAAGGWSGPINLEFRRRPDGSFSLMEANCRLNGYSYLTTRNGLNLPRIVVDVLLGQPADVPPLPPVRERRNFLIGYRETPVSAFLA